MTAVPLLEHVADVYSDPERGESRAECACGWAGDWRPDDSTAAADVDDHYEVTVHPADDVDRFMGELLDLQDDIAAVVVWLAENWTADLPAPYYQGRYPGEDGQVLDVQVQCADDDELGRVAGVLGSKVGDQRYGHDSARLYRVARRHFGRVMVEAWTVHDRAA